MTRGVFKIHLPCAQCKKEMTIVELGGNALGFLFATCICILCNREVTMQVDMRYVAERATRSDMKAEGKEKFLEQLDAGRRAN